MNDVRRDTGLVLGVDVGSRLTKLIAVQQSGYQLEIAGAASIDLPPGIVTNGVISNGQGFAKVLRAKTEGLNLKGAPTVFSIPSNLAFLRWLKLPQTQPDELREAARFKVKRHLPFPVDEAYIEATPPFIDESGLHGDSLVIAVRKEIVSSRAEALALAGLQPVRAELEAQAILRVIERRLSRMSALWRDASMTIIDVGGSNTHMYVVQNQRLQFIRGVKFGANLFAEAIADAIGVSPLQAETLLSAPNAELQKDGMATFYAGDIPLRVNLSEALEKLTREFTRLLRYFRSLHPERSYAGILDHMVVCGGLSGLPGFCEFLESGLGLRVERAQPIAGTIARLNTETFQSICNRQETYAVVMGLALSGLNQQENEMGGQHGGQRFTWTRAA